MFSSEAHSRLRCCLLCIICHVLLRALGCFFHDADSTNRFCTLRVPARSQRLSHFRGKRSLHEFGKSLAESPRQGGGGACCKLSCAETPAIPRPRRHNQRQTRCLKRFRDWGRCVVQRQCFRTLCCSTAKAARCMQTLPGRPSWLNMHSKFGRAPFILEYICKLWLGALHSLNYASFGSRASFWNTYARFGLLPFILKHLCKFSVGALHSQTNMQFGLEHFILNKSMQHLEGHPSFSNTYAKCWLGALHYRPLKCKVWLCNSGVCIQRRLLKNLPRNQTDK